MDWWASSPTDCGDRPRFVGRRLMRGRWTGGPHRPQTVGTDLVLLVVDPRRGRWIGGPHRPQTVETVLDLWSSTHEGSVVWWALSPTDRGDRPRFVGRRPMRGRWTGGPHRPQTVGTDLDLLVVDP